IKNFIHWDLMVIPEQNTQLIHKSNFDHIRNFSITLSVPNHFTSWWEGHNSIQGIAQKVNSISQEVLLKRSIKYFHFNSTQTFTFGKGVSVEISGFFQSKSLAGLLVRKPYSSLNVGIQKELEGNKGTFKLSGEDLLWTQTFSFSNSNAALGFYSDLDIKRTSQLVRLTFSQNFGSRDIKSAKKDTGAEEERLRVQ